ncbi:MAG: motility associated factor glycosyltransferase family protein, partial [Spirochaeta sp.]
MSCPAQYNREVFCARFPEYPVTIPDSPPAEIEILTARNGSPSALFHGKPLHSTRNPEREAERICETLDVPAEAWIILCGFGLGYIALELVHRFPKQRLIILDPDPEPFQGACAVKDISPLLMHPSLTLLIGPDTPPVDAVLADLQYQPVHIVSHKPSRELHPDFYADAEHRIQRLLQRRRVNHNTLKRFGKLWIRNFIANIPRNLQAAALQTAAGKFHGIPGLLVAAGPTFDQSAPYLRDLREHCLIVAVDTALPLCLRNGVDPDIVVVVDPQYWNTRHLDRCGNSRALVVSESSAHPRIFTELHGPFLLGESLFPLGRMLEQHLGTRGKLGAGGSVATSAFEVLRLLGCRKLFTIGLDLGFPESRTHCSGSFFEER